MFCAWSTSTPPRPLASKTPRPSCSVRAKPEPKARRTVRVHRAQAQPPCGPTIQPASPPRLNRASTSPLRKRVPNRRTCPVRGGLCAAARTVGSRIRQCPSQHEGSRNAGAVPDDRFAVLVFSPGSLRCSLAPHPSGLVSCRLAGLGLLLHGGSRLDPLGVDRALRSEHTGFCRRGPCLRDRHVLSGDTWRQSGSLAPHRA